MVQHVHMVHPSVAMQWYNCHILDTEWCQPHHVTLVVLSCAETWWQAVFHSECCCCVVACMLTVLAAVVATHFSASHVFSTVSSF